MRIYYMPGTEPNEPHRTYARKHEQSLVHKYRVIRGSMAIFSSRCTLEETL